MVERLTGGKALPAEALEQIVAKTDGVPLFVEELTKAVLEARAPGDEGDRHAPAGPLPLAAVPATLHDAPHGAPRPARGGEGGGPNRGGDRSRVPVRPPRRGLAARWPGARGRAVRPLGGGARLPAHPAAQRRLRLQARARARHRLRQPAARPAAAHPRPDRRRPARAAPRLPAGGDGPPSHRSRPSRRGGGILGAGGAAGQFPAPRARRPWRTSDARWRSSSRSRTRPSANDAKRCCRAPWAAPWSTSPAPARRRSSRPTRGPATCASRPATPRRGSSPSGTSGMSITRARTTAGAGAGHAPDRRSRAGGTTRSSCCRRSISSGARSVTSASTARPGHRCERGWALYDPERHGAHHLTYGAHDPGVCSRIQGAFATWFLRPAGPSARLVRAGAGARAPGCTTPQVVVHALVRGLPLVPPVLGTRERVAAQAETAFALAGRAGFRQPSHGGADPPRLGTGQRW